MSNCNPSSQDVSKNDTHNGVDTYTKNYIKDKEVFADAFNYFLYGGKKVIHPEQLQTVDTTEVVVPYGEDETGLKTQPVQKIRDSFYSVMTDNKSVFMLLGLENQTHPDNAMPVRNGLYDFMEYAAQVQEAAKAHRKAKNYGDTNDFLSGFHKTDKLIPVYTLVLYWGTGSWSAPRSLFEMLDLEKGSDYYGLNDWKLNLIIPDEITEDEALEKFGSELGKALIYVKNMGNPKESERIYKDKRFRVLKPETALLLNEIMKFDLEIDRREREVDMCAAVEKWKKDATISSAIETLRDINFAEDDIKRRIIAKYNLTDEEAMEYMSKKSA